MTPKEKQEEILSEDEFCYYSGLPSPSAYQSDNEDDENKEE
jgi:hypothetical protein